MKIGVIGAGRLGICFALLCEAAGHHVLVSDIREDHVKSLNDRNIDTTEPEVQNLLREAERFEATTDNRRVIRECDLIYTLVPTPSLDDGSYDVSAIWDVVEDFKAEMGGISNSPKNFVVGSTTNPGNCREFGNALPESVRVVYNPEFIAQGTIIKNLREADMILLGYDADSLGLNQNDQVIHDISALYKKIQVTRAIVCQMSTTAAEVTKIAVNCYLTTKISYANMLGDTLHRAGCGAEISSVLSAIGTDSRIGRKFLNWGVGYGGPCLPRDNRAFAAFAESLGMEYNLGRCTDGINNEHAEFIADYWLEMNQSNSPFYFDYISYKHGTDIIEESQQLRLCTDLLDKGAKVYIRNDRRLDEKVYTDLIAKYGHDKVKIVDGKEHITEDIFIVNL